jgi:tRNA(Ile)-lysidine synthase
MDWKKAAERLGEAVPVGRLHPAVRAWAEGRGAAARGPWSVAFSGGADSVALLLLLWAHWPERRETLCVLHFNHRLRGRESLADARFCASVARGLGLSFSPGAWSEADPEASEGSARAARMAFFDTELEASGSRALWLGHQLDDVAESLLMRLARGSGLSGLAAPRPVQRMPGGRVHLRPLLRLRKRELCEALRAAGVPWREDSSNAGRAYLRNRMRHDVIPSWSEASGGRDALAGAGLARELLEEDEQALEAWLRELAPLQRAGRLRLEPLAGKPRAIVRRALHRWLLSTTYRGDLSRQGFELLLRAVEAGAPTRQSLGNEGFAVITKGLLVYRKRRNK